MLRNDNDGPELISEAIAEWAGTLTGLSYILTREPRRNEYTESFNSRLRDEYLNNNSFYSLFYLRVVIDKGEQEYNHVRRYSSPGF